MTSNASDYNNLGYTYIRNVLTSEQCEEISNRLFEKYNRGETAGDTMTIVSDCCPEIFDDYLEKLLPFFESQLNIRLFPTYSYSRIYRKGERLKKHIDQEACEYTASLTIKYDGEGSWPIYVKETSGRVARVTIDCGDALLFNGHLLEHWRDEYTEGNWQVQIFLHYVNADGPNGHLKKGQYNASWY